MGAVQALGAEHCQFDYGRRSPETTGLVRLHAYESPDPFRLRHEMTKTGCRLLGGHFDHRRYAPLFRSDRVLAFCRDPRQQLMSHYAHAVRHNGYEGGLVEFLASRDGAGRQARTFSGILLEAVGFIGVTERYEESLRVLREAYGLEIKSTFHNVNPNKVDKADNQPYQVPEDAKAAYESAVAKDMDVYRRANALLDNRLASLDAGHAYVHGAIQATNEASIRGFAFDSSLEAVTMELEVNGKPMASCKAVDDRPGLRGVGVPRNGYVGFDLKPRKPLQAGDQAIVKVASSEQMLGRYAPEAQKENA